jgi:hypothetical protein
MPVLHVIYFMANPVLEKQRNASSSCYLFDGKPSSKGTEKNQFYLLFICGKPSSRETGKCQFYLLVIL